MPEIMSAEKLVLEIRRTDGKGEYTIPDWMNCEELIRSRDAAIIEKCKDKIRESKYGDEWVIRSILDSVLAEIEEE